MKKYLNVAFIYAIAAMIGGVFYREFTKFNEFTGDTVLGKVHTHLFILGMMMFMLIALFAKDINFEKDVKQKKFMYYYNFGLILMVIMMIVRGILQVLNTNLSKGVDSAISGIAGIGHILFATGIFLLFNILKRNTK